MKKLPLLLLLLLVNPLLFAQNSDQRGLKTVVSRLEGETAVVGRQFAVLIAINQYQNWMALDNPVRDAREIKEILSRRYFVSDFLELYDQAATKAGMVRLFSRIINEVKPEDSVLIFYAGHGYLDKTSNTGFWIPVDGGTDVEAQANWLPNAQIRGFVSNMKARHIALIADSCFSGDILNPTRGASPAISDEYFKNAYARVSRQVLTSGASESVPDESQFSRQLKLALEGNTQPYLDLLMLYSQIRLGVKDTTPLFGGLKDSGHQDGSSFLLFYKEPPVKPRESPPQPPGMKLKLEKTYGSVTIETASSGTLLVDGESIGSIPAGKTATLENVETGNHRFAMRYDDGEQESAVVLVKSGGAASVSFVHTAAAPLAAPAPQAAASALSAPASLPPAIEGPLQKGLFRVEGTFADWQSTSSWNKVPTFIDSAGASTVFMGDASFAMGRISMCRDDRYLYWKVDFAGANPITRAPRGMKKAIDCELTVHIDATRTWHLGQQTPELPNGKGLTAPLVDTYSVIHDGATGKWSRASAAPEMRNTEKAYVARVSLEEISRYCKGPVDVEFKLGNDAGDGTWDSSQVSQTRSVDFSK